MASDAAALQCSEFMVSGGAVTGPNSDLPSTILSKKRVLPGPVLCTENRDFNQTLPQEIPIMR